MQPTEQQLTIVLEALAKAMGDPLAFDKFIATRPDYDQCRAKLQDLKDERVRKRYDPTNPHVKTGRLWNSHGS